MLCCWTGDILSYIINPNNNHAFLNLCGDHFKKSLLIYLLFWPEPPFQTTCHLRGDNTPSFIQSVLS